MSTTTLPHSSVSFGETRAPQQSLFARAPDWVWDILAYAPAIVAVPTAGLALRSRKRHPFLAGLALAGATAALFKWQLERFFVEKPDYVVEHRAGAFEVRRYAERVVAQTRVANGDFDVAREEGFKRLATYIFRGNDRSRKIAMTAPVNVQRTAGGEAHDVTFMMPEADAKAKLPRPNDPRVRIRTHAAERVAALRFRATYDAKTIAAKKVELLERVRAAGLVARGEPSFAGYDAPSTLPFLRRVEVWVTVDRSAGPKDTRGQA